MKYLAFILVFALAIALPGCRFLSGEASMQSGPTGSTGEKGGSPDPATVNSISNRTMAFGFPVPQSIVSAPLDIAFSDKKIYVLGTDSQGNEAVAYLNEQGSRITTFGSNGLQALKGTNRGVGLITFNNGVGLPILGYSLDESPLSIGFHAIDAKGVQQPSGSAPPNGDIVFSALYDSNVSWLGTLTSDPDGETTYSVTRNGTPALDVRSPTEDLAAVWGPLLVGRPEGIYAATATGTPGPNPDDFPNVLSAIKVYRLSKDGSSGPVSGTIEDTIHQFTYLLGFQSVGDFLYTVELRGETYVRRILPDSLSSDSSFGSGGSVKLSLFPKVTGIGTVGLTAQNAFVDSMGRVLVCGIVQESDKSYSGVWRLTDTGALDSSFGSSPYPHQLVAAAPGECRRIRISRNENGETIGILIAFDNEDSTSYRISHLPNP